MYCSDAVYIPRYDFHKNIIAQTKTAPDGSGFSINLDDKYLLSADFSLESRGTLVEVVEVGGVEVGFDRI